jgi:O-antigen/teichoic acid export membrane protein
MSLARIGIRGAYFTSLALGFRQVVSLLTTFYVARHLLPADIGLFSLVMIVIGLAQVVGDIGLAAGVVRSQNESPVVLSTAFWIGTSIGSMLSIVVYLLAPVAGNFYNNSDIVPFLRVSALGLLLNFLTPVPMALLQQRLAYQQIALSQSLGSISGALAAGVIVTAGFGVWGLVFQPIIGNAISVLMMAYHAKWRPTFQFQFSAVREIVHNGVHLLGSGVAGYLRNTFDVMVIGKSLPAQDLGMYGMAQTILYAPMHLITSTISRVIFPLLAKVQKDLGDIKRAVLTATARTALLIFPLYFGLIILADEFVFHVFGENWLEMVPLIRIMATSFIVQSIGNVASPLMLALGKTKTIMNLSIAGTLFYFIVLLLLIPYGLTVVAIGYVTVNSSISIVSVIVALRHANISLKSYLVTVLRPFILASIMGIAMIIVKYLSVSNELLYFLSEIFIGIFMYFILVLIFEKNALSQFISALKKA